MLFRQTTVLLLLTSSGCSSVPEPSGHPVQLGAEVLCTSTDIDGGEWAFEDIAVERGLVRSSGPSEASAPQEALLGVGLVVEDLDGDGDLDVALARPSEGPEVFENTGEGRFRDQSPVFSEADLLTLQNTSGVYSQDFDHDGLQDLMFFGPQGVWFSPNRGSLVFGSLRRVYSESQADPGLPLSAVQADWDQDGDLDLVLPGLDPVSVLDSSGVGTQGSVDRLLERRGERYVLTETLASSEGPGISMVGLATDRDGDGDLDLLAPSLRGSFGMTPTSFYTNPGGQESSSWVDSASEIAANLAVSGMGIDSGDLNDDGYWDYCISDLNRLQCLLSQPDGSYSEGAQSLGIRVVLSGAEQGWSGWSLELADLDNDGNEDLAVVAGAPLTVVGDDRLYAEGSNLLWRGGPEGFEAAAAGSFQTISEQYGLVAADVDEDGRLDLLSTGLDQDLQFHRLPCSPAAWTSIRLAGPPENPRGLGAVVELETDKGVSRQEIHGVRGLAQGPARAHFGLGTGERIERLTVHWPDGVQTESTSLPVNRSIRVPHPARLVGGGDTAEPLDTQDDTGGEQELASLGGLISRTAPLTGDGLGELVVMVFEGNPMDDTSTPPVAWTSMEADFSGEGVELAYQMDQIPVREAPYFIIVFLDDDRSGTTTGPSSGDLVAMESMMSFPQVTLNESKDYEVSFVLNIGVP